jgi:hypothetical protein
MSAKYAGASAGDPPMAIPARSRHNDDVFPHKRATLCGEHIEQADHA